jgi:hypothetical protein
VGAALHRVAEGAAGLDVAPDARDRLAQLLVLGLVLEGVERTQHRHSRGHQRRELPRENGQLAHADALEPVQQPLQLQRLALLGYVEDDQPPLAKLLGHLRLAVRLHLAPGGDPCDVDCAECEGAHRSAQFV